MKSVSFILTATVTLVLMGIVSAHSHTRSDLQDELSAAAGGIETVKLSIATEDEPAVRQLMERRLVTLQLTQDILRNRILVLEGEEVEVLQVPVVEPDMVRVAEINSEIVAMEAEINEAEVSLASADGVNQAIIAARLESQKLALAELRLAYIGARYGMIAGLTSNDLGDVAIVAEAQPSEVVTSDVTQPVWADRRYPNIDYSNPLFQQAYNSGQSVSGWWVIYEGGNRSLTAQNVSNFSPSADSENRGMLLNIICENDETSVALLMLGGYFSNRRSGQIDVGYQVDNGVLRNDLWSLARDGEVVELEGEQALGLIDEMASARSLSVLVPSSVGGRQNVNFDLAGYNEVAVRARELCSQQVLALNRSDYRLIQTLLNIAGFKAGQADGIWGQNSRRAMADYQRAAGITESGRPDLATLKLLGLVN